MGKAALRNVATAQWEFAELREKDDYVYVDKTDMLARLAMREKDALYFIARPRRFGKSLMLTTLRCMFEGRRKLFRGLKIMKTGWDWKKTYPVILINMQTFKSPTPEGLEKSLYGGVRAIARQFGLRIRWKDCPDSGTAFTRTLEALGKRGRFVVLVDEYDVPLQGFLGKPELETVRQILHDFYSAFKSNVGAIRFLMMTGVSKFTKLSVFSSLNNLTDLTIQNGAYAALLGYTHDELKDCFAGHVAQLGERIGVSPEEAYRGLLAWYDSYRFSPYSDVRVINPVALGHAFNFGHFGSFWSDTGMPTLILERLQAGSMRPDQLNDIVARPSDLDVCDAMELPWLPLLYQAGYLTIKDVEWETSDEEGGNVPRPVLKLGIPNFEVRDALKGQWWTSLMKMRESDFTALVRVAERQVASGDVDGLLGTLFGLYAKLPPTWTPKNEADAKRYFLIFMEMAGARMRPEKPGYRGYADAIVETKKFVWVFEFKYQKSAKAAIRQIREKGYADAYKGDKRPVTLVGVNLRLSKRNIDEPLFAKL